MKFAQFLYSRPDMDEYAERFNRLLEQFEAAGSAEGQNFFLRQINDMRAEFTSMYNICHIRHTINTKDEYYEGENDFFDQQMPNYQALNTQFYYKLLASPFRDELKEQWGSQLFNIAEMSLKTFRPEVLEDLQEENRLSSEYTKLKAGARIEFQGEEHNLSSIQKLELSEDRRTRREAGEAKWAFFAAHKGQLDEIFDQLVKIRHRIARKLGFDNFVELGYVRMLRSDYNAAMVANFRRQVLEHIVPIATRLYDRQRRRLGLDRLLYFDEDFRFLSGNPQPKGDPDWIIDRAGLMYAELSPETNVFFHFMRDNDLMDLTTRPGKATGGYCTFIDKYRAPYIFSNFNGTSGDIDVLTHEAGHAFQVYSSREAAISEYNWPTYEACEIHSMSMEFFTWPWMKLFFQEETEKHLFSHLSGALCFMPYGAAVDEFQHFVYEHPEATPAERDKAWREIEKKYLPHRDYAGNEYLENGGFWKKQSHIYNAPFYYIDYALAEICAFQFWKKDREDHEKAWADYVRLCNAGGSLSFLSLVELAGLRSPFEEGCVASVTGLIEHWLDGVADEKFLNPQ
jgi:M3 family oligoendopeptidase